MEKFKINDKGREDEYDLLKNGLLDGAIPLEEVKNKLVAWDQSTPSHDASAENLNFLYDPQIITYINQHPEAQKGYYDFLSFTEFHVAQRMIMDNPEGAEEYFRKALESARAINVPDTSWTAYIEGSLLYMGGKKIPEEIIEKVEQPQNAKILRSFNAGLEERGAPSYMEDYNK